MVPVGAGGRGLEGVGVVRPDLRQTSSIGVSRPWEAKKRRRLPANHFTTSSGLPCRYELIWFWNVLWSVVLIVM